jgi:hypothetical protein
MKTTNCPTCKWAKPNGDCTLTIDCHYESIKPPAEQPSTKQVGGDHYTKLKIQPMNYSMANGLDALQHTAIKYVTRFRDKGGIEDLRKAIHCIDMLIEWETNN